jgi:hypothetical protein
MKQSSSDPPDIDNTRPGAIAKAHGVSDHLSSQQPATAYKDSTVPLTESSPSANVGDSTAAASANKKHNGNPLRNAGKSVAFGEKDKRAKSNTDYFSSKDATPTTHSQEERSGPVIETKQGGADRDNTTEANAADGSDGPKGKEKRTFIEEARRTFWLVATYSWLNVLLIFVPIGIIVANIHGVHGGIVFAMNCIAVIPLAGLLSHATESVASEMGDSLGALLNVTFGNAVELIIFIIALVKDEIRIVQASLLGSILANLLLILGMGFFLGGLRYREQVC